MLHFDDLWNAHPAIRKDPPPTCHQGVVFASETAVAMGMALSRCGIDTTQLPGVEHCLLHDPSEGHILYAEGLAHALQDWRPLGVQRHLIIDPVNIENQLRGMRGIIFIKGFSHRSMGADVNMIRHRPGDRIDLWNGYRLTTHFPLFCFIPKTGQGCARSFADTASNQAQGQFLDDQAAAQFIQVNLDKTKNGAVSLPVPKDFPARIINPDGTYTTPSSIRLVPGGKGVKTAYPEP